MTPPEKPASAEEYSFAEWDAFYRQAFRASTRLLTQLEEELAPGLNINPQQAGLALLICMGRLQGRYGYRHVGARKAWEAWVGTDLRPVFELAFRGERATED